MLHDHDLLARAFIRESHDPKRAARYRPYAFEAALGLGERTTDAPRRNTSRQLPFRRLLSVIARAIRVLVPQRTTANADCPALDMSVDRC